MERVRPTANLDGRQLRRDRLAPEGANKAKQARECA